MRYKAAAKKLKQITELADPTPVDVVLPPKAADAEGAKGDYGADEKKMVAEATMEKRGVVYSVRAWGRCWSCSTPRLDVINAGWM